MRGLQELYLWESVADAGRRALRMRYRLLPHLFTAFKQSSKQGSPVAKPLWFAFPHDAATHAVDDQWLFGDVLITPVLDQVCSIKLVLIGLADRTKTLLYIACVVTVHDGLQIAYADYSAYQECPPLIWGLRR